MSGKTALKLKRKLIVLCAAGTLFQSVQCTQTSETLMQSLFNSVASVFITDYFNHLFGVTTFTF